MGGLLVGLREKKLRWRKRRGQRNTVRTCEEEKHKYDYKETVIVKAAKILFVRSSTPP